MPRDVVYAYAYAAAANADDSAPLQEMDFPADGAAVTYTARNAPAPDSLRVAFDNLSFELQGDSEGITLPTGQKVRGHLRSLMGVFEKAGTGSRVMILGEDAQKGGLMHLYDPTTNTTETRELWKMHSLQRAAEDEGIRVIPADTKAYR